MKFGENELLEIEMEMSKFIRCIPVSAGILKEFVVYYNIYDQVVDIQKRNECKQSEAKKDCFFPLARIRYVRSTNLWRLFRMRKDGAWRLYSTEKTLAGTLLLILTDTHGCFFGRTSDMTQNEYCHVRCSDYLSFSQG